MSLPTSHPLRPPLDDVVRLARAAAALVMAVYARDFAVRTKDDASPVTEADECAEALIVAGLRQLDPTIAIVAEEMAARGEVSAATTRFWLVDPLDGTKEFVSRNGEFTVNIALIEDAQPVLGVVAVPARGRLYAGLLGAGAWVEDDAQPGVRRPIAVRPTPAEGLTVVASRSHGDAAALAAFLAGRLVARRLDAGSSLKLCLLAEGQADLYPRLGRTMEWDIAAGHAVLAAAGGTVCTLDGAPLRYGKPGFENPHFVASGATHGLAAGKLQPHP